MARNVGASARTPQRRRRAQDRSAPISPPPNPPAGSATIESIDGVVVTAWGVERFSCPVCEVPRDLVTPDCGDDHDDCGDRACAVCGFAISIGGITRGRDVLAADRKATTMRKQAS